MTKAAADLALDTPMYGAHTTLADMLWAGTPAPSVTPVNVFTCCSMPVGVPVLSLPVEHMATRMGVSLVSGVTAMPTSMSSRQDGLADSIVTTHKEYEEYMVVVHGF